MTTPIRRLRQNKWLRELLVLAVLVTAILAARSSLADHYHVPSGSMEDTLLVGDRVFVDKRAYGLRIPFTTIEITSGDPVRRGDIAIFDSPTDGKRLIKRIVAIGGDDVVIANGLLTINGQSLRIESDGAIEVYGDKRANLNLRDGGGPDWHGSIPDGQVFAVGDHRGNSADGRIFGVVDADAVYGKAVAVYYRRDYGFSWLPL